MTRCPQCGCQLTVEISQRQDKFNDLVCSEKPNTSNIDTTRCFADWVLTGTGLEKLICEANKAVKYRDFWE